MFPVARDSWQGTNTELGLNHSTTDAPCIFFFQYCAIYLFFIFLFRMRYELMCPGKSAADIVGI